MSKLEYDRSKRKGVDYGTWREKKDPTGSQRLRETIDAAIAKSHSYDEFLSIREKNYQIKKDFQKNGILNIYLLEVMTIKLAGSAIHKATTFVKNFGIFFIMVYFDTFQNDHHH